MNVFSVRPAYLWRKRVGMDMARGVKNYGEINNKLGLENPSHAAAATPQRAAAAPGTNAAMPVMPRPNTSAWTSCVPS